MRAAASAGRTPRRPGRLGPRRGKAGPRRRKAVRGVGERAGTRSWDRFPESKLGAAAGKRRGRLRHLPSGSRSDKTLEITRRGGSASPGSNPVPGAKTLPGRKARERPRRPTYLLRRGTSPRSRLLSASPRPDPRSDGRRRTSELPPRSPLRAAADLRGEWSRAGHDVGSHPESGWGRGWVRPSPRRGSGPGRSRP